MKKFFKKYILPVLPKDLLQMIKRHHYINVLRKFRDDQEPEIKLVRRLINKGDLVVDIGANIGIYTKCLSEMTGNEGKVISVEPVPSTFKMLKFMKEEFKLNNVELVNCAISDQDKIIRMEIPCYETGDPNFYQARIVDEQTSSILEQITIQAKTVDSLFADLQRPVAFIKCDVEGNELPCLNGAKKINGLFKPAWLIEVCSDPDDPTTAANELFKMLETYGYKAFIFNGQSLHLRKKGDKSINYFFLSDKHMLSVKECIQY